MTLGPQVELNSRMEDNFLKEITVRFLLIEEGHLLTLARVFTKTFSCLCSHCYFRKLFLWPSVHHHQTFISEDCVSTKSSKTLLPVNKIKILFPLRWCFHYLEMMRKTSFWPPNIGLEAFLMLCLAYDNAAFLKKTKVWIRIYFLSKPLYMSILYCICQGRESITCLTSHLTTFVSGYNLRQASLTSRCLCFTLALLQQKNEKSVLDLCLNCRPSQR